MTQTIMLLIFFCFNGPTFAVNNELYIDYVNRVNSFKYVVKKGDTLAQILKNHGYENLKGSHGAIKLTQWKNGIKDSEIGKLEIGREIYLPYIEASDLDQLATNADSEDETQRSPASIETFEKKEKYTIIGLKLSTHSLILTSKEKISGSTAKIASSEGFGASGYWSFFWDKNKKFETFLDLSFKKYKFNEPTSKSLDDPDVLQKYQGAGLAYSFIKGQRMGLTVGQGDGLILVTTSNDKIQIKPWPLMATSVFGSHQLLKFNYLSFSLSWRAGQLLPAKGDDFTIKGGSFYDLGLGLNYERNGMIYFSNLSQTERSIKLDVSTQTAKETSLAVGIGISF